MALNQFIKAAALRCGFEIHRFQPAASYVAQLQAILRSQGINLIFDVGANTGHFGRELRDQAGYTGRIVSFEPLSKEHEALRREAAGDKFWEVAPRMAIGAQQGTVTINVAANSWSSSILPMLSSHVTAAPRSGYVQQETVPLEPLDAVTPQYFREDSVALLKIDTQGYENEVLKGAGETVARIAGLQLELSLVPLYDGQKLMPEMLEAVAAQGFKLWAIAPAFLEPGTGRLLQVDATFFRDTGPAARA